MRTPEFPPDESARLAALRNLLILDTDPEERFDALTFYCHSRFKVAVALVSLVDAERQWFKSACGLDARETSREVSFCGHTILGEQVMVVPDARRDPRFFDNPLVAGPPFIRFYAGAPLTLASGHRVAFVFGAERTGMTNDDVYRCHACLSIPTDPAYGSLNLAQAVQLIAYDWRQALGGFNVAARTPPRELADGAAVAGLLAHWEEMLLAIGFLDPAAPKKLMPRLQQLFNRAELGTEEVHILRGIAREAMSPRGRRGSP